MRWKMEKLRMILRFGRDTAMQVMAILEWLSGIVHEDDRILVNFPGYRRYFYFEFPLRYGDKPRPASHPSEGKAITFIVRQPSDEVLDDSWVKIFSSPTIEFFENKVRISGTPPLRWGLADEEKKLALKVARDALEKSLSNGERLGREYFRGLPARFFLKTDLDVSLWVSGHFRGSHIVENRHLVEGIQEAAIAASRDSRFKPLDAGELKDTRIEITIMHRPRMPITERERQRNQIFPEKGYLAELRSARGYYLPQVFNVKRFRTLHEFLVSLAVEKAKIQRSLFRNVRVYVFEVDGFIDSKDHQTPLTLWGPIVKPKGQPLAKNHVLSRLKMAADWLCRMQEPDGNIPAITDPLTGRQMQIDWPRLAFTAWAMFEFARVVHEPRYADASRRCLEYLRKHLFDDRYASTCHHILAHAFYGQLALSMGRHLQIKECADMVLRRLEHLPFEPVTFSNIASFLHRLSKYNEVFHRPASKLVAVLKENFEKTLQGRDDIQLAAWLELANTFWEVDTGFSHRIMEWAKSYHLPNGMFPASTSTNSGYTRSTAKAFEVLALDSVGNNGAIEKTLVWLFSMQYTEDDLFFAKDGYHSKLRGGFRHDYFNTEAWIDAAAHVLLGGSRLINK